MGIDPVGVDESNVHSHNRYAYGNNNPYKFVDPTGNIAETALDVVSLGLSIAQFNQNPSLLNGLGLAYDIVGTAVPILPAGFGIIRSAGNGVEAAADAKTYVTYTKKNLDTGEVYSGRASGYGTPEQILAKRDAKHHMNRKGFEPAELDRVGSKNAIRGREQNLIDAHGGAKSTKDTSGNAINGISDRNKNAPIYRSAAKKEFGN